MLATDFARRSGRRLAWYKLDAPDSELSVFLRHLCASLGRARPGFGAQTLARLGPDAGSDDVPLAVEHLVYELLESNEPALVVIDDLHLVYDAEWMVPFFRRWLPLLPREVHVMLLGRSLPPTPRCARPAAGPPRSTRARAATGPPKSWSARRPRAARGRRAASRCGS